MRNASMEYSAGAFVFRRKDDDLLFLVLRKRNGEYDLPKGHIEKLGKGMETPLQAAIRETAEETGIKICPDPFFVETVEYTFRRGDRSISKRVDFFLAETESKNVKISKEHAGFVWMSYAQALKELKYKDTVELLPVIKSYIEKRDRLKALNREYAEMPKNAQKWDLSKRLVPGEGRADARIMLIGQAPGDTEDETLRPFVGRSGQLLDSVLMEAGIDRRDTYITSTVQFFPPENRMPTDEEVALCLPFLKRQIEIIAPKYVILMGNLAVETVLGIVGVTQNHGASVEKDGVTYLITFHPAAALRFPDRTRPIMVADFKKFAAMINDLQPAA